MEPLACLMLEVIEISAPVFGLSAIGYFATRGGWFSEQAADGLGRFVFNWATPFLLIRVFSSQELPQQFPWALLLSFYIPVAFVYLLGFAIAGGIFGRDAMARVIFGLSSSYGNTVLLGLPLILLAYDGTVAVQFLILISVHSLLLLTVSAILLEYLRQTQSTHAGFYWNLAKGLFSHPVLLGVMLGLALNFLGLDLPGPLDQIARYMQQAVPACALFALGASLARYRIAGRLAETWVVTGLKNLLLPLAVWLCADLVFGLDAPALIAAVVMAALPCGVHIFLFAERYGAAQRLATTSVFLSTVVSVGTLTAILAWLNALTRP